MLKVSVIFILTTIWMNYILGVLLNLISSVFFNMAAGKFQITHLACITVALAGKGVPGAG